MKKIGKIKSSMNWDAREFVKTEMIKLEDESVIKKIFI